MSSYRKGDLDNLLRVSLQGALWRREPATAVWSKIEREIANGQHPIEVQSFLSNYTLRLFGYISEKSKELFSVPDWHERLDEHRFDLLAQLSICPGARVITAAVV